MTRSRHICCVISSLGIGGAERVMSLLANQWVAAGDRVTLVTFSGAGSHAYDLDPRVKRVGLDLEVDSDTLISAIRNNARKVSGLRRALKHGSPEIVVSFIDRSNVLTLLATVGLTVPVIISERIYPPQHAIGALWSFLRRMTYRLADALVVQSEDVRSWAKKLASHGRIYVIPNPIGKQFAPPKEDGKRKTIVLGVGRLDTQKGFDLLIEAFATVRERHDQWRLMLLGQGPRERELMDLAARLLPPEALEFVGSVKNPEDHYRSAGLFVLSSRYEGFPNALLEAMASGCAVIAADCPGGISQIITNGANGLLVPPNNVQALAEALDRLLTNRAERDRLGSQAEQVRTRFSMERIRTLWNTVLDDVSRTGDLALSEIKHE